MGVSVDGMGHAPYHELCPELRPEAFATKQGRPQPLTRRQTAAIEWSGAFDRWLSGRLARATWRTVYLRRYGPAGWLPVGRMCQLCRAFEPG